MLRASLEHPNAPDSVSVLFHVEGLPEGRDGFGFAGVVRKRRRRGRRVRRITSLTDRPSNMRTGKFRLYQGWLDVDTGEILDLERLSLRIGHHLRK